MHDEEERRQAPFCKEHNQLIVVVAKQTEATINLDDSVKRLDKRINGSFETIADHVRQGERWRIAIMGIVLAGFIQIFTFAYFYGQLSQMVKMNTKLIERLDAK